MNVHEQVLEGMKEMAAAFSAQGVALQLPPSSSLTLGTRYTELDAEKSLAAAFEFNPAFANPLGMFQGGFLCAAFDEVYGPLSYMVAKKPVLTIEMSTSFLRPFSAANGPLTIKAEVVSYTKSLLVLKAEARAGDGKLIATSTTHGLIAGDRHLK